MIFSMTTEEVTVLLIDCLSANYYEVAKTVTSHLTMSAMKYLAHDRLSRIFLSIQRTVRSNREGKLSMSRGITVLQQ